MAKVIRKQILDKFQEQLSDSYAAYCERHNENGTVKNFIGYALDQELFTSTTVNRYCILKEFKAQLPLYNNHKTRTVAALADKFNLSERTVWSVVKNGGRYGEY